MLKTILLAALLATSCGQDTDSYRYQRSKATAALGDVERAGLVLGEFTLAREPVVDGDTLKVEGLPRSLRLLGLDAEETFKKETDRRDAESDWDAYLAKKKAEAGGRPPKIATPLGEEAKRFAKRFFADVRTVRLERDHAKEIRDRYDRYLAYAFVQKNGVWLNYNVECVRAGMSPYFTKYGYSRRYHEDFVAAEKEARAAGRGIWAEGTHHNPDYPVRRAWWDARAEFVKQFEVEAAGKPDWISLTRWDAMRVLQDHVGKEVVVLGTVGDVIRGERGPIRVTLTRRLFNDLTVIFWDPDVFAASGIARFKGEFVRVRGVVGVYHSKRTNKEQLQVVVNLPGQVTGSQVPGLPPDLMNEEDD
ncbi:MAG TPA: thermonuclease family protein [Kofleriaceae bacterium]|jgi:endonuclease YncB( thermonuclease family)|nr:thermonuclease family protein [Kofleriaceae bacterium]